MKIDIFQNQVDQAHKRLKKSSKKKTTNFRTRYKNSNIKFSVYKKKFRTRK